jgi:peptidoglycan/xylan/chitin deacetylase (PgdA/CDA1 family)
VVRILRAVVRRLRAYQEPKALVLMYHRVAEPATDVWDLAVSPTNFEQQLRVLQRSGLVVPAEELVSRLASKTLRRRSIVITFDDGYCDNYLAAKSLLEQYKLPATFFIATGNLGQASEFWWDELEDIFLLTEHLPAAFDLAIVGQQVVAGTHRRATAPAPAMAGDERAATHGTGYLVLSGVAAAQTAAPR